MTNDSLKTREKAGKTEEKLTDPVCRSGGLEFRQFCRVHGRMRSSIKGTWGLSKKLWPLSEVMRTETGIRFRNKQIHTKYLNSATADFDFSSSIGNSQVFSLSQMAPLFHIRQATPDDVVCGQRASERSQIVHLHRTICSAAGHHLAIDPRSGKNREFNRTKLNATN